MSDDDFELVDWMHFEKSRAELGACFIRILSYFREDGAKSVAQIEEAMHDANTAALVIPAHTIKGEAGHFVAELLAKAAELIESTARLCVKTAGFPDKLVPRSSSFANGSKGPQSCSIRGQFVAERSLGTPLGPRSSTKIAPILGLKVPGKKPFPMG